MPGGRKTALTGRSGRNSSHYDRALCQNEIRYVCTVDDRTTQAKYEEKWSPRIINPYPRISMPEFQAKLKEQQQLEKQALEPGKFYKGPSTPSG
ncbi:hypothetical protein AJ78_05843 [Emergomyces pasteurianus Ep9510]|uniref:Uncharacterized protein n=1 Tax=Emergomyces pasteurianus Ep9510 TaxID=1447872 RepID=A0A1J9Q0M4_9EURO|nr:hypothetical protein AJ78_05843 [Emergomyces pasteurianus Ep9510]